MPVHGDSKSSSNLKCSLKTRLVSTNHFQTSQESREREIAESEFDRETVANTTSASKRTSVGASQTCMPMQHGTRRPLQSKSRRRSNRSCKSRAAKYSKVIRVDMR